MRKIAIFNQKGGVAKTTTTINLAAALAVMEKKLLVIDIDSQSNASTGLGFKKQDLINMNTVYDCMLSELPLTDAIVETNFENIYLVPANKKISNVEQSLNDVIGREMLLKNSIDMCLDKLDYDFILIDFPPSLGLMTVNGLVAADEIIIPVECEGVDALDGINDLMNTVRLVRDKAKLNPNLTITGALLTKYLPTNLANEIYSELKNYFGDKVFENVIRKNVAVGNSKKVGKPVIYYDRKSTSSEDYLAFAKEVLNNEVK